MMDTCSDHGDEHQFFDAIEEITTISDSTPNCTENSQFDVWIKDLESVQTRRSKFFNLLGLDVNESSRDNSEESDDFEGEVDKITSSSGRITSFEYEFSSSRSSMSCWYDDDDSEFSGNLIPKEISNERNVGDRETSLSSSSSSGSSNGEFSRVKSTAMNNLVRQTKKVKKRWLSRLRSFTSLVEREEKSCNCDSSNGAKIQRVKVHQYKKETKELSALYFGQSIQAHKGAILTMKFSPDGQFLASGGEDRIVRVWKVVEDDRLNEHDIPNMDPSCVYFTMNQFSELKPLNIDKEKNGKLRRNSDSACVVLPPKVFRILENPLHEFRDHTGEILDLSWSKNNCLLSSSVDKTVRLWRVGFNHCLEIFQHNNYVTCIQFNPIDDNCFISGSIDGKVRIWEISHCKVVNWTEIKDIVTAVCYHPDGQGGIIGSITGSCRFYSISDNLLQLDAHFFLDNKKKSSGKRITGFQYFPQDPSRVMVSCADSQVRIIQGVNVVGKYKGLRSTGTYSSAFFTSDGRHIVSTSEDSNVYIWNSIDQDYLHPSQIKKVKSYERFLSNVSVALPWPGSQNGGLTHGAQSVFKHARFSRGQEFFLDSYFPRGSALWPEEKLKLLGPTPLSKISSMHKSVYKFLRTCQSRSDSNAWGLVIVTAGWDGRIRSFHNYGLPAPC